MSKSATVARRRAGRRRTFVRRWTFSVGLVVVVVVAVFAIAPLFQKAIRDLTLPLSYSSIIRQQAAAKHLDPALVAAVIDAETGFDARTSPAGAEGLMQMEPATAQFLAKRSGGTAFTVADLATPQVNIAYGSYYLRYLLNEFGGDETAALAAYNGGDTNVGQWIRAARAAGHPFGTSDIPFPQTRAYVEKVENLQQSYRRKYPAQLGYS
jgi:soluble lytic murein transglycosylase